MMPRRAGVKKPMTRSAGTRRDQDDERHWALIVQAPRLQVANLLRCRRCRRRRLRADRSLRWQLWLEHLQTTTKPPGLWQARHGPWTRNEVRKRVSRVESLVIFIADRVQKCCQWKAANSVPFQLRRCQKRTARPPAFATQPKRQRDNQPDEARKGCQLVAC